LPDKRLLLDFFLFLPRSKTDEVLWPAYTLRTPADSETFFLSFRFLEGFGGLFASPLFRN